MKTEPAFPVVGHWYGDKLGGQLTHGMTLRDYFAAKAMQGLFAGLDRDARRFLESHPEPAETMAKAAFLVADAMLKARDA